MSLKNEILIFDYDNTYNDILQNELKEKNEIVDDLLKAGLESNMADNFKDELTYQLELIKKNNEKNIYDYVDSFLVESYLNDDIDYLMSAFHSGSVIAYTTLRTWNSERTIDPLAFDNLDETIKYVRKTLDFDNLKIVRVDDDLVIYFIHHDNHHSILIKKDNNATFFNKGEKLWEKK